MNQKKNRLLTRGLILILFCLVFCITFCGCSPSNTDNRPLTEIGPKVTADTGSQGTVASPTQETSNEMPGDSSFEVNFIDVGQADSAIILCDGKAMLIDGGNAGDSSVLYH